MPKTPLQTEILGAIELIAGYYTGGTSSFLFELGASTMVSGALQEVANLTAPDPVRQAMQAIIRSTTANMPIVYGQAKVGGVLCFSDTYGGTENPYLCVAIAHSLTQMNGSAGVGVDGIADVWIDNIQIPSAYIDGSGNITQGPTGNDAYGNPLSPWNPLAGNLVVKRYDGSQAAADSTLHSDFSTYWKSTAIGKGVAYTMFQLYRNPDDSAFSAAYPRGIPGFMGAIVNGQKVYDPRQDSTNGGSGTQRFTDPTTWTFSSNPALCAADYLTRAKTDGGAGVAFSGINWASVAAAANICDESITLPAYGATWNGTNWSSTQTTARYSCNIALDTGQDVLSNLQTILSCMAGKCIPVSGQLYLYAGAYDSPTDDMDESYLAGECSLVAIPQRQAMWNMVKGTYCEPLADYQTIPAEPIYNSSYETADGSIRLQRTLNLPGVNNQFQAQYLEIIESQRSRNRKLIRAKCNLKAFGWKIWDTVTVSISELGISGDVYRVVEWQLNADQSIDVLLQEEASTTYDFALSQFTAYSPPLFFEMQTETPAAPSGLTATAGGAGNLLQWTPPPDNSYLGQTIQRAPDSGGSPGTWATVANGVRGSSWTDTSAVAGTKYWYQIGAYNLHHQSSAYCTPESTTATTAESGATAGATIGPGGNVTGAVDGSGRAVIDFNYASHLNKILDSIGDGPNYSRPLTTRINAGRPWIDFSESIHSNKTADYIAESGGRKWAAESGADITGGHQSASTLDLSNHVLSDNLIQNPNFVNGLQGWNLPGFFAGSGSTSLPVGSTYAQNTVSSEVTGLHDIPVPIDFNKTYYLEAWIYCSDATATNYLGFAEYDGTGTYVQHDSGGAAYGYPLLANGSFSGYTKFAAEIGGNGGTTPAATQFNQNARSIVPIMLLNYNNKANVQYVIVEWRLSEVAAGAKRGLDVTTAGSGRRIGDGRNLIALNSGGYAQAYWSGGTATPGATTMTIPAMTLHVGGAPGISYNSSSASGLTASTTYSFYYTDPSFAGGSQTLQYTAAANKNTVCSNDGNIYIGDIATTASGGSGGGGSIGTCVTPQMMLRPFVPAAIARAGTKIDAADNYALIGERLVQGVRPAAGSALRLTASPGYVLECGADTPFTMPDGSSKTAAQLAVGDHVLTDGGDQVLTLIEDIGCQPLIYISAGGISYAAGVDAAKRIYSHNTLKP